jgi:hypothetical protein
MVYNSWQQVFVAGFSAFSSVFSIYAESGFLFSELCDRKSRGSGE